MPTRLRPRQTLLVGSLIFGLFFGAGNLIFPVQLGRTAGQAALLATAGFLLTAVGLPVLGVIASARSGADSMFAMIAPVSRRWALFFTCALYLTIGPLFAIPRTATVSFEVGVRPLVGDGTGRLAVFSLLFFAVVAAFALRPGRLLDWVGRYLTPIFLVLLFALVVAALVAPMTSAPLPAPGAPYDGPAFSAGLLDGYNTMDALASLAFAIVIVEALRRLGVREPRRIAVEAAKAGVVGGLGMALVYSALAYVGATSVGAVAAADNGGALLASVSRHFYGDVGQYLIAAIVALACLKTSIGLVTACARMFDELFSPAGDGEAGAGSAPGGSRRYRRWALAFVAGSLAIANVGLSAIIAGAIPVLMFLYPVAVVTIALHLVGGPRSGRALALDRCVIGTTALAAFFDLLAALPEPLAGTPVVAALTGAAGRVLPGYDIGFGWVGPALLGVLLGLVLRRGRGTPAAAGTGPLPGENT